MIKKLKPIWFLLALSPAVYLVYLIITNGLGPDPAKTVVEFLGIWALRFLWIALSLTPLKLITGNGQFISIRRMMGLYAFFYVCLHLTAYLLFMLGLQWSNLWEDILERPYITVGFAAWLVLLPLAITSTNKMIRRLGKKWKQLHKGVYLAACLAALHFIWLAKSNLLEPIVYLTILILLFALRFIKKTSKAKTVVADN
ncbi:sulfite oxidase heme-binding subunit YedZ [Spartinivicinus poritis]|uniref:Protein-methionine-sulfoxide reductase heme-binding subunit MsrQ n=1 Tax=Spartinivicinus poritis TaxID=2994640 RepID=A0ABT5U9Y2_9GAMM|nr:protein-methionine-sulfoxide reductase heme-binding subunit MsrQ [Spartinivicinus sp. A2-2]MDE1463190.1 sulfoxide reductase heme-binding subunit YedZ [Spartinivicinus sp. A2-2]